MKEEQNKLKTTKKFIYIKRFKNIKKRGDYMAEWILLSLSLISGGTAFYFVISNLMIVALFFFIILIMSESMRTLLSWDI